MSYQREFERRVRIGVVGAGWHCYRNILPSLTFLPVELAAVCDLNAELAEKTAMQYGCAAYTSAQEMYAGEALDAALICVGPQHHPHLAIEAFEAGLHVFTEKPPAMRASGVERMIAAAGDRVCVIGFKKAFMPSVTKVREILALPEHAPLFNILAEYPMTIPENGAEVLEKNEINNWLANGCHPISLMLQVGGRAKSVRVQRAANGGALLIEFRSGALGVLPLGGGASGTISERYTFLGKDCRVILDNSRKVIYHRPTPFDYARSTTCSPEGFDHGAIVWEPGNMLATLENKALFSQGIVPEIRHFCDCVLEGRQPDTGSLAFALEVMKIYEAGLMSDGEPISID